MGFEEVSVAGKGFTVKGLRAHTVALCETLRRPSETVRTLSVRTLGVGGCGDTDEKSQDPEQICQGSMHRGGRHQGLEDA